MGDWARKNARGLALAETWHVVMQVMHVKNAHVEDCNVHLRKFGAIGLSVPLPAANLEYRKDFDYVQEKWYLKAFSFVLQAALALILSLLNCFETFI